ncbi:MAG TPA: NfeD family protein [Acidimicrobiales bacterium]|nr:NfeD family protein [Acidimicrobiales bacterium]
MDSLFEGPAVVLVALTFSAALLLVEIALPTFGLAGLSSLLLAVVAYHAGSGLDAAWWPLVLAGAGVFVWALLLLTHSASRAYEWAAAGLYATGGVGYGVLADSGATVAIALACTAGLLLAFRPLRRATVRLRDLPAQTGMDALVGRTGTVVSWNGGAGTVRVDGSLWNAACDQHLTAGTDVVVSGYSGMTVHVVLAAPVS